MSTRLSVDLFLIGLLGSLAGWFAHAPDEPQARASYLCAPVRVVASTLTQLEVLLLENDGVTPPTRPWSAEPAGACRRLVVRISADLEH